MPRPTIICHMTSAVDGRIRERRWSPPAEPGVGEKTYEAVHDRLAGDAWICGRVTMQGYTKGEPPPPYDGPKLPRDAHIAKSDAQGYAIGLDPHARMHWGARNDIAGDHVVMVLTEGASDAHLDALRRSGVSYVFGGRNEIDLETTVTTLAETFGIKRLLVEGGGRINGSFLRAGLIDELSLLLAPAVDGLMGQPAVFDYEGPEDDATAKHLKLSLVAHELLAGGTMWLRYRIARA